GSMEAGEAEERGLMAGRPGVPALVGGVVRDAGDDATRVGIEAALRRVADVADDVTRDPRHVGIHGRDGIDGEEDEARRDRALGRNLGSRILVQERIDDAVRDLIADLVGVPTRYGL